MVHTVSKRTHQWCIGVCGDAQTIVNFLFPRDYMRWQSSARALARRFWRLHLYTLCSEWIAWLLCRQTVALKVKLVANLEESGVHVHVQQLLLFSGQGKPASRHSEVQNFTLCRSTRKCSWVAHLSHHMFRSPKHYHCCKWSTKSWLAVDKRCLWRTPQAPGNPLISLIDAE